MNFKLTLLTLIISFNCDFANANHDATHEGCKDMKNMDFSMKELDLNKDGDISLDEYAAANQGDTAKKFNHMDANNDGKLDSKEQKDVENVLKAIHNPKAKTPVSTI
ncbi:MAG: hypothetical protein H7Z20_05965 [Bdellovibrio sp.]|nr:hypothetical protein [Methylotenera sp.]